MECNKCGWAMPYDIEFLNVDCISCDGKIRYTADEFVEHPSLGIVSESRGAQIDLTKVIVEGIRDDKQVVVEAGTGVGKSFAYLLPALLSGRRTVISTAKKTLQTQLIEKDLPYLQKKLGFPNTGTPLFARAYGKGNYACYKKVKHKSNKSIFRGAIADEFFKYTKHGVWEEAPVILKKRFGKPQAKQLAIISRGFRDLNAENCEGPQCSYYSDCHYIQDRNDMGRAQIVVANHWLTGLDIMLQQQENIEFFGHYSILIVDEAHKFEDGVRSAFTREIKKSALREIINTVDDVFEYLSTEDKLGNVNCTLPYQGEIIKSWNKLFAKLTNKSGISSSSELGIEGPELAVVIHRSLIDINHGYIRDNFTAMRNTTYSSILTHWLNPYSDTSASDSDLAIALARLSDGSRLLARVLFRFVRMLVGVEDTLNLILESDQNNVVYIEDNGRYPAIKVAPIDVNGFLTKHYNNVDTAIFTSATLAIGGSLQHFTHRMGIHLPSASQAQYGSAFNFDKQALLYISRNTQVPYGGMYPTDSYIEAHGAEILSLIEASDGNAFILFTSTSEMRGVHDDLLRRGCVLPLIMQDGAASETLRVFKETPNAVLMGLKSFWEGVDIPGDKLELVVIAKLPFPLRSDPIIQAKCDKEGDNWFQRVYIPEMVLELRQGVGRLIRSKKDRGVVAILDARLEKKNYKNTVLRSLGFSQVTINKEAAISALRNLAAQRV